MAVVMGHPPAQLPEDDPYIPYARPITVATLIAPAGTQVHSGQCLLCGWTIVEPSGTGAAVFEIYDGMDATAQLVSVSNSAVSGNVPYNVGHDGILCYSGIFIRCTSGQIRGVIYVRHLEREGE